MAAQTAIEQEIFSLRVREDGIAVVSIDVPGESQNTLKLEFLEQMNTLLDQLEKDNTVQGLIFISGKPDSFIAGADINMLKACKTAQEAMDLSRLGQRFCNRIEGFKVPLAAAIDGTCLGGGLELALACATRVCTDSGKTALGLPEVKLGLLPASGGTQRLPRLVGIGTALDMMLTGRHLSPARAKRMGLVDDVVPAPILLKAAVAQIQRLRHHQAKNPAKRGRSLLQTLTRMALEGNKLGRHLLFREARKRTLAKTKGHYPAPERIIDCIEIGANRGFEPGLEVEARTFGELAVTPEARELMNIYLATTAMKKDTGAADPSVNPRKVNKIGVLGAGLMGAGIGFVSSDQAKVPVRLKDQDFAGLSRGLKHIDRLIRKRRQHHSITPFEADLEMHRITPTLDFSGYQSVDLVIEAVFEDLELKQWMLGEVETHCPAHTIFATNTSSIPIARIAAVAYRPENLIGMHYFSPVEKMPLLEVIATEKTAPEVIATAVDFGRRQGKTVIVVKDGAGFYINRILGPYINEAGHLLKEAIAIDTIDRALTRFGFPVGPFTLLDEVGIDVGSKVAPILYEAFGERLKPTGIPEALLADGRYGRKSKKGFYRYEDGKNGEKRVDESVYALLGIKARKPIDDQEIIERCVLLMVNEAARCWEEGVLRNLRDGDIGAVFGIGFPPFLGGPFRYADRLGSQTLVDKLQGYRQRLGERFKPADILMTMAKEGRSFYQN